MRTQFLYVGLLSAFAGGLVGTAGCDNVTAGQPSDPKGPPVLEKILIQDAIPEFGFPNRVSVVDLLDNAMPQACSEIQPCVPQFTIDFNAPDVSCNNGFCNDPLKVPDTGIPLAIPTGEDGDAGSGMQIRLVFSKVLDRDIETITNDPMAPLGSNLTYALKSGVAELDDPSGPVDTVAFYDPTGSPSFPADLELELMGPAIVLKPTAPLAPATKYTIKLNTAMIKDRQGNAPVDQNGNPLPATYTIDFTTEDLQPTVGGAEFPDFSDPTMPPEIAPEDVIQLGFWAPVAGDMTTITVTGPAGIIPKAFTDRGDDPTACTMADQGGYIVDVANTDAAGTAIAWPEGMYTLTYTAKALGSASTFSPDMPLSFTVKAPAMPDPDDPNTIADHIAPAQCTGM